MTLRPVLLALLLAAPFAAAGGSGPTACEGAGSGLPVLVAAGTVAIGEVDAYAFDDVQGKSIDVWRQKAPDAHGAFTWRLSDRATGAVFGQGDAVEVPLPVLLGASPYDDLCLELSTAQGLVTQYLVVVTAE